MLVSCFIFLPLLLSRTDALTIRGNAEKSQVTADDFNNDGKSDVVFTIDERDRLFVYQGNGTAFTRVFSAMAPRPISPSSADLDGDGMPDVVVCARKQSDISVFYNDYPSSDRFSDRVVIFSSDEWVHDGTCHHTMIIDVDDDGKPDIVYSRQRIGGVYVLINPGDRSSPWTHYQLGTIELGTHQVASTHTTLPDGDKVVDMLVCMDDLPVRWIRSKVPITSSTSTLVQTFGTEIKSRAAAWVDIDADGMEDAVICDK